MPALLQATCEALTTLAYILQPAAGVQPVAIKSHTYLVQEA